MTRRRKVPQPQPQLAPEVALPHVTQLGAALNAAYTDQRWLNALELALPTGVCNTQQLQRALELSRDAVNRLLARFEELAPGQLLVRVVETIPRPGQRGQPPALYKLGPAGAALLRTHGYPQAHPCGLDDVTPLAHAAATLDVCLAARAAHLPVRTETLLPYGPEGAQELRPDNLVTLPDGTRALFETEQHATLSLLRRIVAGLRNKVAFFQDAAAGNVSPTVRVLINLARGKEWETTVAVWERAVAIVADSHGGQLPWRLVALPLAEFLAVPDWGEPPDPQRWESLHDPTRSATFAHPALSAAQVPTSTSSTELAPVPAQLPASLLAYTPAEERLILQAFLQHFQEHAAELAYTIERPRPDPAFFATLECLYLASHNPQASPLAQASHPVASLYLLNLYLGLHPQLRAGLNKALTRGAATMRWNPTNILHRMQTVIDLFLRYHGFRVCRTLQAYPNLAPWDGPDSRGYGVTVQLHPELLVEEGSDLIPGRTEVQAAEQALAWVLWALFAYADDLAELKYAPFW